MDKELIFIPSQKEAPMLLIDQFAFQNVKTNKDGSIFWKCQDNRRTGKALCSKICSWKQFNRVHNKRM